MSLDRFLATGRSKHAQVGRKCMICRNTDLGKEVQKYVDGVQSGKIKHSTHYIWLNYFGPTWSMGSLNTLRNHIKLCMGIDL